MMCPRCKVWEILDGDNFCSWCGEKFTTFDVEIHPHLFLQNEYPPPAELSIRNRSLDRAIAVERIEPSVSWIRTSDGTAFPLHVGPGSTATVELDIDPLSLTDDYHRAEILVHTTDSGSERADVEVVPAPDMAIRAGEYQIFLDNRAGEDTSARIEVRRGVVVVRSIVTDPAEWITVKPAEGTAFPVTLDARDPDRNSLDLTLFIDEAALIVKTKRYPQSYAASLRIDCEGFEKVEPLTIQCWRPPQCWIWERQEPAKKAFLGKPGEVSLHIENVIPGDPAGGAGNAPLEIRKIEILNENGSPNTWLNLVEDATPPIRIDGGGRREIRFHFVTQGITEVENALGLGLGLYRAVVVLQTNLPDPEQRIRLLVSVEEIANYQGILAIDFGTSNTCCAMLSFDEDQFHLIPIDSVRHNATPTTTPTVLQYQRLLDSGERELEIGALAESQASDPQALGSTVRSPKRSLGLEGEKHKIEVRYRYGEGTNVRYSAREVVTDYLRRVRLAAEKHGQASFGHIVITHPARFKMAQLADLKAAVLDAFGSECRISTLQEPVAAALNFIVREEQQKVDSYTLGVFDFGGGTTDISLLAVKHVRDDGLTDIQPVLVSSTGEWFGGEDLTKFILERGYDRCRQMAAEKANDPQASLPVEHNSLSDPHLRWLARVNRDTLFRWAEATKLLLINLGDDHLAEMDRLTGFPILKLHILSNGAVREMVFDHAEVVPHYADFDKHLRSKLESLAETMKSLVGNSSFSTLDYVLLSGLSSRIPAVGEILQNAFPGAKIIPASKPKECVVAGACIPTLMQGALHTSLTIEVLSFTISRVGLLSKDHLPYVFAKLIDAGKPIPKEGLLATTPILFGGQGITLLENDSEVDNRYQGNTSISELGSYTLEPWPEQFPANAKVRCSLELRIMPDLDFTIAVRVPGFSESFPLAKRQEHRKEIKAHAS